MKKMVGKLDGVLGGANTQGGSYNNNTGSNVTTNTGDNQQILSSLDSPAATLEKSQSDTKGNQTNANANANGTQKDSETPKVKKDDLKKMIDETNKELERSNISLRFKFHEEVGVFSVAVVNMNTDEVIKELPPEEMVKNMIKGKIWMDAFIGTLIDESA
jgi:flagellar protein FlaG